MRFVTQPDDICHCQFGTPLTILISDKGVPTAFAAPNRPRFWWRK